MRANFGRLVASIVLVALVTGCAAIRSMQGKDPEYDCAEYRYGELLYEELVLYPEPFWRENLIKPGYCKEHPLLEGWAFALRQDIDAYFRKVPRQDEVIVTHSELGGANYVVLGKVRWPVFEGADGFACTEGVLAGRALQVFPDADAVIVGQSQSAPADTSGNAWQSMLGSIGSSTTIRMTPSYYLKIDQAHSPDYWMTYACGGIAVRFVAHADAETGESR
ncbi:MAG: hypothetical protein P8K76_12830 [Candidatus Binatia bacterium]|nr:hypothetical protein [Candidatus Binatia bacterium]MDG2010654.1 hypothetical protein [Candidatus Binatia bacterium]